MILTIHIQYSIFQIYSKTIDLTPSFYLKSPNVSSYLTIECKWKINAKCVSPRSISNIICRNLFFKCSQMNPNKCIPNTCKLVPPLFILLNVHTQLNLVYILRATCIELLESFHLWNYLYFLSAETQIYIELLIYY